MVRQTLSLFLCEIGVSALLTWGMLELGLGELSSLLGGVVAGALVFWICYRFTAFHPQPQQWVAKGGQGLIGMILGYSLTTSDLGALVSESPFYLLITLGAIGGGIGIALLYAKTFQIRIMTALLATAPGGAGLMASVAADYGEDVSLVGLTQISRNTILMLIVPILVTVFFAPTTEGGVDTAESLVGYPLEMTLVLLGAALVISGTASGIATQLKVPVGSLIGGMVGGILFGLGLWWLPQVDADLFAMPWLVTELAQVMLGVNIGEYLVNKPIQKGQVWGALQTNGLTVVVSLILAGLVHVGLGWDWMTSLLSTALGGSAEMVVIALTLDHDHVGTVTATHLVRVVALTACLPLWLMVFRFLDKRFSPDQKDVSSTEGSL